MSSTAMNNRESPLKEPSIKPTSYLSLPDDLLLSCFARVSRFHYPTLSLVSKRFRSLLDSPELYKARSLLGCTESCLYVCLRFPPHYDPSWFILYWKQNQTPINDTSQKKKKSSGYVFAPVQFPHSTHSPQCIFKCVVAAGSNIYVIGGHMSLSRVSILNCRSHTWHEAPSMHVERCCAKANVFDGKIYVAGGCKDYDASNWMEVFDPKTQTWEFVLSTLAAEKCESRIYNSGVIGGEIVMFGDNGAAYKPKEDKWEVIENVYKGMRVLGRISSCAIDNVLYSYTGNTIKWYDSKTRYWIEVKGLENLPNFGGDRARLVDYGGKIVVLWDKLLTKEKLFSCAVIALERRNNYNNNQEIWGKIEWFDGVLTVPASYGYMCAVAATI